MQEGHLSAEDLYRAAEVLVTSTAGGIMPVTVIDGQPVGTGAPGPLTLQLRDRYWASHEDPRYSAGTSRFRAGIVARSRFAEDMVAEQAGNGVTQYVILGAGLDTSPSASPSLPPGSGCTRSTSQAPRPGNASA